ncbi:MAG TPA: tetratricopeptide repeat protein [Anaerolineae bacterium]|nr:tetratricopeptide repeat protein [Anaerolineae bacterium]HMR63565.1 tetratricopeptide repeat protein [Anaerolineae bacterium]
MPTIEDGRTAIEQGNLQQARLIFEAILQETPRSEEAWLGLAEVLTENEDKRICYENALKINKNSEQAKEGLRQLEPQSDPLIAALGQAPLREDEAFDQDDATMISSRDTFDNYEEASEGPPTIALVAIGLLLSVVVFALGSGAVFFILTSMTTP